MLIDFDEYYKEFYGIQKKRLMYIEFNSCYFEWLWNVWGMEVVFGFL
jgi:hypothetical protein